MLFKNKSVCLSAMPYLSQSKTGEKVDSLVKNNKKMKKKYYC